MAVAKTYLILSALAGGLAVLLGAFAAHGLKGRLVPELLAAFRTGVDYQFYHALALLGVAILLRNGQGEQMLVAAGLLFIAGLLLFSGSLYGMSLLGWKWLGAVTPLGGLCFVGGWACLLIAALRLP
jgi:uncharacterized membrane protein YgdD (TMEM256/DUF423 family)